jgi:hypothetical protein
MRLNSIEEIERWVLAWGVHATVVRPKALADRVQKIGQKLARRDSLEWQTLVAVLDEIVRQIPLWTL